MQWPGVSEQPPSRVDQVHEGDRYELSEGEAVYCPLATLPQGLPHAIGAMLLGTDPDVSSIGTGVGHALSERTLRAPDLSVGDFGENEDGWATKAPPLAVEYVVQGQDEADLQLKIRQLLEHGSRFVWVVRLVGPRRVEVYENGRPVRTKLPGERLEAPGVLKSQPLVEVLYDREASFEQTLLNLLERKGYASLDAVLAEGERKGEAKGLHAAVLDACEFLDIVPSEAQRSQLETMGVDELETLRRELKQTRRWPA